MKLKELPNTVVHCKTREEHDRLMQMYEDSGWSAIHSDKKPTSLSYDKVDSCISLRQNFRKKQLEKCNLSFYKSEDARIISFSEFLREQGIAGTCETKQIDKHNVYQHPELKVQLWERDGIIVVRKNGRKGKQYTVAEDIEKWVAAFFDGYLAAQ